MYYSLPCTIHNIRDLGDILKGFTKKQDCGSAHSNNNNHPIIKEWHDKIIYLS